MVTTDVMDQLNETNYVLKQSRRDFRRGYQLDTAGNVWHACAEPTFDRV
jgi:hypothetical protein